VRGVAFAAQTARCGNQRRVLQQYRLRAVRLLAQRALRRS